MFSSTRARGAARGVPSRRTSVASRCRPPARSRATRILHVATFVFPDAFGGAERLIHGMARAQAAAGHDVTVLAGNVLGRAATERLDGFRLVRYPMPSGRGLRFFLDVRREVVGALRTLAHEPYDILQAHQIASAVPAFETPFPARRVLHFHASHQLEFEAERLEGAPAATRRALPLGHRLKSWGIAMLDRRCLERAERIMVYSEFVRGQVEALLPAARERVRIVPPGLDVVRFSPGDPDAARNRLGLAPSTLLLVTVRRLVRRMGIDLLIGAVASLRDRGVPCVLVIGGTGPERRSLESLRDSLGLAERVRFLDRVPDEELPSLLRAADLVVVPSRSMEGFGMSTIEALACGAPVIATDGGASPEVLAPIDRALLVPADATALADRIEQLLRDPDRRRALGVKGVESVRARFTWPMAVARMDEVYGELLGSTLRSARTSS